MIILAVICVALGGAFLFEGVGWAIVPSSMREAYQRMLTQIDDRQLHLVGVMSVAFGTMMLVAGIKMLS